MAYGIWHDMCMFQQFPLMFAYLISWYNLWLSFERPCVQRGMTPYRITDWLTDWLTDGAYTEPIDTTDGGTNGWTDKALTNCIFYWCCICWIGRRYLSHFYSFFSCVSPSLSLSGLHFVCICIENHSLGALVVNKSSVKINYKLPISCHKELIKIKTSEE